MLKSLILGAAALAFSSSLALAQSTSTSVQSTTSTTAPVIGSEHVQTQQSVDSDGTVSEKRKSLETGPSGMKESSSSRTQGPDGSETREFKEKRVDAPAPDVTVNKSTTTTVDHE